MYFLIIIVNNKNLNIIYHNRYSIIKGFLFKSPQLQHIFFLALLKPFKINFISLLLVLIYMIHLPLFRFNWNSTEIFRLKTVDAY